MTDETAYKASVSLPREVAETIAAALTELLWPPADAIGLFDNEDGTWRVEATFQDRPDEAALDAFLRTHGAEDFELAFGDVPPADWVAISQSGLHPVRAGRFVVHGSHDRDTAARNRWSIEIDAGQAFGTAHHGSTLGCLKAIDDLAKRETVRNVLDLGAGTGILAIAAAQAWRTRVTASDIDPVAVDIARQNVRLNRAAHGVATVTANGLDAPVIRENGPYDLVIANILARPLVGLAHEIARAVRPGGLVILSGITTKQAEAVAAAYQVVGFTRLRRFAVSDWVTLALRRRTCRIRSG